MPPDAAGVQRFSVVSVPFVPTQKPVIQPTCAIVPGVPLTAGAGRVGAGSGSEGL